MRRRILATLGRDVDWLRSHGLMDYSLVVGVIEGQAGAGQADFPAGMPGADHLYHQNHA